MTRKARKNQLEKKVISRLKEVYGLSDRELESGSVIYQGAQVLPDEIAEEFFRQFGVEPTKSEFGSWSDFVAHLADKIICK